MRTTVVFQSVDLLKQVNLLPYWFLCPKNQIHQTLHFNVLLLNKFPIHLSLVSHDYTVITLARSWHSEHRKLFPA